MRRNRTPIREITMSGGTGGFQSGVLGFITPFRSPKKKSAHTKVDRIHADLKRTLGQTESSMSRHVLDRINAALSALSEGRPKYESVQLYKGYWIAVSINSQRSDGLPYFAHIYAMDPREYYNEGRSEYKDGLRTEKQAVAWARRVIDRGHFPFPRLDAHGNPIEEANYKGYETSGDAALSEGQVPSEEQDDDEVYDDCRGYCRQATDRQLRNIYADEKKRARQNPGETGRVAKIFARAAKDEMEKRGISESAALQEANYKGYETSGDDVTELRLFIDNDADLYRGQTTSIHKNLMTKIGQGKYNRDLAVKLFMYLVDAGAQKYTKEYSGPGIKWHEQFPKKTRQAVAVHLRDFFENEAATGNYNNMLPAKYSTTDVAAILRAAGADV
jgi:hypothetical protein